MSRIHLSPPHQNGREPAMIREVLASNYLAPVGPMLDRLEEEMVRVCGLPHAVALQSGSAALQLAFRHLLDTVPRLDGRPPVVVGCTLSFVASVAPAAHLGCEVRLVDAEEASWTMDPIQLSHALTDAEAEGRTVLCVVPTDLYGQACDLDAVHGLCDPKGVPVVCDSAEALGVARAGGIPRTQIISFNGNKILTCGGGGVLLSVDPELVAHARKLSTQAREPVAYYEHRELGYNLRLSNLNAAVAVAQLESLTDRVRRKREVFQGYRARLDGLPGVTFMPEAEWNAATRWLTVLCVDPATAGVDREHIRLALEAEDIESRPVWKPLHLQPVFRGVRTYGGAISEGIFERGLCLPSGTALAESDLDRVCETIRRSFPS